MNTLQTNYENDFYQWSKQQIILLKDGKFNELDIVNLIKELEDMGKSTLRELESRLIILLAHLLKWEFQLIQLTDQWQAFEGKSWRNTIIEQRVQLLFLLKKVPSLKSKLTEVIQEIYPESRTLAIKETGLSEVIFPVICPYSATQILEENFYPNPKINLQI